MEDGREIPYDDLVIGLGCEDDYHGVPGAEENTLSIQTIANSRKTFEMLCGLPPGSVVAIVGAGLSGIEIASELRESRSDLQIKLFDRSKRILRDFPEKLSKYVKEWFEDNNVEIIPESNITKVEPGKLYNHDEVIEADAIVWTAGVRPVKIVREMDAQKDKKAVHLSTNISNWLMMNMSMLSEIVHHPICLRVRSWRKNKLNGFPRC